MDLCTCFFNRVTPTLQQDADLLTRQNSQRSVLLFYDDEPDEVVNFFLYCTNLIQTDSTTTAATVQVVQVYGNGANEERILKKTFNKALTHVRIFDEILKSTFFFFLFRIIGSYYIVFIIVHRFCLMSKRPCGNFVQNVCHQYQHLHQHQHLQQQQQCHVFGLVFNVHIHFHHRFTICV